LKRREPDITASVAGALLGVHDYETPYGLWAKKSNLVPPVAETANMVRGTLFEDDVVELIRRRHPDWIILYPVEGYYRDPASRLGCTPDVFVPSTQQE
jgi:predicted phage-related endonuclease